MRAPGAAAAYGTPLTHRGVAQAVTFVTGHAAVDADGVAGEPDLDWAALARPNQTVVVYMGLSTASAIARRLMAAGRAASTPVLLVENASRPDEQWALCTLSGLPAAAQAFAGPAVLVIGEVAAAAQAGPALRSSLTGEEEPARRVEGASAANARRPSQSASPAAPPGGEHLGAAHRVRA